MYLNFRLNIAATCILVCSFTSTTKAQLASTKPLAVIYNKQVSEKLAKKNNSKQFLALQKEQNLPSAQSSLKDIPKLKIKNPQIVVQNNSIQSHADKKNKLPSNLAKLKKQIGATTNYPGLPLQ